MTSRPSYRTWPVQLAVVASLASLAMVARMPDASGSEKAALAGRFHLIAHDLPAPEVSPLAVHEVNRAAAQLKYYLYQVGASAALGDLDGDGLPNDLCITDIRSKEAMVMPVPGTGDRYSPFVIDLGTRQDLRTQAVSLCKIEDLNEDGLADLYLGVFARPPVLLLRKDPGDLSPGAPLRQDDFVAQDLIPDVSQIWWTSTTAFSDLDGDGHLDMIIGNYFPDGAKVTDATSDEPFEMNDSFSRAENGGTNHIFLYRSSTTGENPSVTYVEAPNPFPGTGATRWTLALGAADLDQDGRQDLYVANDHGSDQLLMNRSDAGALSFVEIQGAPGFNTPESERIGHDSFKGMGIDFADINDDQIFDMYVSNIASDFGLQETHFLWLSNGRMDEIAGGVAPWDDAAEEEGVAHSSWSWESRFVDLNLDGVLEMVQATGFLKGTRNRWADFAQLGMANDVLTKDLRYWPAVFDDSEVDGNDPNAIFVKAASGRYANVAEQVLPGLGTNSRGIALADVDGDGDPDMVYANLWEDSDYIENDSKAGRFLGLHLLLPTREDLAASAPAGGAEADAPTEPEAPAAPVAPAGLVVHDGPPTWREGVPAVGAFVKLVVNGHTRIAEVDGGNGHSGQRAPEVVFGLGDAPQDQRLDLSVHWRDRSGKEHDTNLTLEPGWHTVVLADAGATR